MLWIAIIALIGRIILLGYERIAFKQAGQKQDTAIATFWLFFLAAVVQIPSLFIFPWRLQDFLNATPSALIYTFSFSLYVYALSNHDVSLITPFYNFNVFFLLILSILFLGEPFFWFKLIGMMLLFYGTIYLNKQQKFIDSLKAVYKNRGCQLMIVSSLLMAIGRVLDKIRSESSEPAIYAFAIYFIMGIILFFYLLIQKKIKRTWNTLKENPKAFFWGGFTNAYSYLFLLIAFIDIDVTIADPISMLSIIVSLLLSAWIFKENIKNRMIGSIIMIIGAILLIIRI